MALLSKEISFNTHGNILKQSGNLVYQYAPFRNYRITDYCFQYKTHIYSLKELNDLGIIVYYLDENKNEHEVEKLEDDTILNYSTWKYKSEDQDITGVELKMPGDLVDFDTDELSFSINNPVDILPQYSYDGSVNLILNDGKNIPRLINSRFSALGKDTYQIVDRKGDNDTNIYDQGSQFDIDTSLYKRTTTIPKLIYQGVFSAGNLLVGNYHFYFKYMDADGNESDFIAESGLVSIFIGEEPYNISSGFRDQNTYKGVQFYLSNLDEGYQYISVYYTKATSDILENATVTAYKIQQKFIINSESTCLLKITGFEEKIEIPKTDINPFYQIASNVETQASCQNMLFFGNIHKEEIPYQELSDISLRFLPTVNTEPYNIQDKVSEDYTIGNDFENSYYNSEFIYNKVGYWPDEIYRFGIVYILKNHTLSPVFNIRGKLKINKTSDEYTLYDFINKDGTRNYIPYTEDTYLLTGSNNAANLENAKGVFSIDESMQYYESDSKYCHALISIKISLQEKDRDSIIKKLQELGIRGFFFVRQKRIPTTLCEAYMIGVDKNSHTPVIPYSEEDKLQYIAEGFLNVTEDEQRYLSHDYLNHIIPVLNANTAAICPEYDINSPYLNTLFNGDTFVIKRNQLQPDYLKRLDYEDRYYYSNSFKDPTEIGSYKEKVKILGVEDNVKLTAIDDIFYSARAGEAEEAFRFEYANSDNLTTEATNLLRGSFGPYLGINSSTLTRTLFTIKIPGYNESNMQEYFQIRNTNQDAYYAVSDRFEISEIAKEHICYRGDCYICQVTHRVNRNFQDPSAPTNDIIVDKKCWEENYEVEDGVMKSEKFEDINLGDVNAVQLGQWITFTVRSTMNLNVRAIDDSRPDETALTGHPRTFFPNGPLSVAGVYKTPEALCYNKGFEKSLSERVNFETPDVPAIKNDFTNRIAYSDIHIIDAFKNGFRVFQGTAYRDYPKTYGQITKIIEFQGNLLCVFEHGISLIPVNERAVSGEGSGGNVYINTSNVLPENPKVISDTYGSQWKDSIIKTPRGIYGVDTIGKKIWRTNGGEFEILSDFRIQKFLNKNITLQERENTPILGIRNVKTHYNKFKNDVMFTFYDNLHGFEEKVWNICYNEIIKKWVTFYSWVPSFSENIYNQFFSFDRDTSKYISKLGVSKSNNDFSDGITLDNNIISTSEEPSEESPLIVGNLSLSNRELPEGSGIDYSITYTLERDVYGNYKYFKIPEGEASLYLIAQLPDTSKVFLLNISAKVTVELKNETASAKEYQTTYNDKVLINGDNYKSTIALIKQENLDNLTTSFWKSGQAGIINSQGDITPTHWYGKQHPFEFEIIVADNPQVHKVFDNLEIIGNSAEPESFHYEIIGDCFDFAKHKENMYIRQEATKRLYQYNGSDISYDDSYEKLHEVQYQSVSNPNIYEKSTILPLWYSRQDGINEIEDYYHLRKDKTNSKDFSALAGGEIVKDDQEYHIWNHAKAVDMIKEGRLRGNMHYKEDKWYVQINPLNIVQQNEPTWDSIGYNPETCNKHKIPIELTQCPIPEDIKDNCQELDLPEEDRQVVVWSNKQNKETKMKDKWIKIRVRYDGTRLATINAIKTLYSISYS